MSIQLPYLSTIGGGVEAVHIIPLEEEIDRAVRAFEVPGGFKANRVYLLAWVPDVLLRESDRNLRFCHHVVRERLEALGIETVTVLTNIFDLLDVIKKVSSIVPEVQRDPGGEAGPRERDRDQSSGPLS
jgi:hypothetical protein